MISRLRLVGRSVGRSLIRGAGRSLWRREHGIIKHFSPRPRWTSNHHARIILRLSMADSSYCRMMIILQMLWIALRPITRGRRRWNDVTGTVDVTSTVFIPPAPSTNAIAMLIHLHLHFPCQHRTKHLLHISCHGQTRMLIRFREHWKVSHITLQTVIKCPSLFHLRHVFVYQPSHRVGDGVPSRHVLRYEDFRNSHELALIVLRQWHGRRRGR